MQIGLLKRFKKIFHNVVLLLIVLVALSLLVASDFTIVEVLILFPKETKEVVKIDTIPSDFSRPQDLHFYHQQYFKFYVVLGSLYFTGGFDTVNLLMGAVVHSVIGAQLLGFKILNMIGSLIDSFYSWKKLPPSYDNNLNNEFLVEAQNWNEVIVDCLGLYKPGLLSLYQRSFVFRQVINPIWSKLCGTSKSYCFELNEEIFGAATYSHTSVLFFTALTALVILKLFVLACLRIYASNYTTTNNYVELVLNLFSQALKYYCRVTLLFTFTLLSLLCVPHLIIVLMIM